MSTGYRQYLESLAAQLDSRDSASSALLINLGPVWDSMCDLKLCMWQAQDCKWEEPAGMGLCPLETLSSICARIHEHVARTKKPMVILHPHTCTNTGNMIAYFITAAHYIFSMGVDSIADALGLVLGDASQSPGVRLLPSQKRYCEYLTWLLHHPHLLPADMDSPVKLFSVTFAKLSTFDENRQAGSKSADNEYVWRPERLLMGIFCRGRQVWSGGVLPGSIDEDKDHLTFELHAHGGKPIELEGDVIVAVWFEDHKSRWTPPKISYAFHTAFIGQDGHSNDNLQISRYFARHLDTPGSSESMSL